MASKRNNRKSVPRRARKEEEEAGESGVARIAERVLENPAFRGDSW